MPEVTASPNSSLHATISDTFHFVVFDHEMCIPYSTLIQKEESVYNYDNYVTVRVADFQKIYRRVTNNINVQGKMERATSMHCRKKLLSIGDVYVRVREITTKLDSRFKGH